MNKESPSPFLAPPGSGRVLFFSFLPLLLASLFVPVSTFADSTRVYITRDANGNPVFTDQPIKGAEVRDVQPLATIPALKVRKTTPITEEEEAEAGLVYQQLKIISPMDQENVPIGLADQLVIKLSVEPELGEGDQVRIKDGSRTIRSGRALQYSIGDLERGQHLLSAEIVSENQDVLISSGTRTIYIQRPRSN